MGDERVEESEDEIGSLEIENRELKGEVADLVKEVQDLRGQLFNDDPDHKWYPANKTTPIIGPYSYSGPVLVRPGDIEAVYCYGRRRFEAEDGFPLKEVVTHWSPID